MGEHLVSDFRSPREKGKTAVILVALLLAVCAARLRFVRDPPDWDVATYALIGSELAQGKRLYSDIWDMKPPAIFASFAAAEWVTRGSHEWSAYLLSTAASIAAMIGVYFAALRLGRGAALWGAALWAVVALQPALEADTPNTEAFINACLAIGMAIWLWRGDSLRGAIAAGAMFAIATLFKQVALAPALAIAISGILSPGTVLRRRAMTRSLAMLAMIPLAWIAVLAYFGLTNRADIFFRTNFVYARSYSGSLVRNIAQAFTPGHLFPPALVEILPLILLAIVGLTMARPRPWLIALWVGSFLAVALPGQFFVHYYQLWLVPLVLAAASGAAGLMRRRLTAVIPAIVLVGLIVLQWHWFALTPRQRTMARHPASLFMNVVDAGQEIAALLRPDETMYVWCDEPQLYWLARKRPPAAALWKMHTVEGPLADRLSERSLADLRQRPPDLIVLWSWNPGPADHPIYQWIRQHYAALPDNNRRLPLSFLARRGSDLLLRTQRTTQQ